MLLCIWSSRSVCCLQHSAEVVLGRILFRGRALSCSWRINPGKPLVCRAINLCGVALPEGTHAHIQTRVQNNTRDYQCCQVVWSERTSSSRCMWECLVILSPHNECFCFWGDKCVLDHPSAGVRLTPHPADLCAEERRGVPEGSLYSMCVCMVWVVLIS